LEILCESEAAVVGVRCASLTVQLGHWIRLMMLSAPASGVAAIDHSTGRRLVFGAATICVDVLVCTEYTDDGKPSSVSDSLEQRT
jgi:hypothetical protein